MSAEITCQSRDTPIQSIRAPSICVALKSRERPLGLRAFGMRDAVAVHQRRGLSVLSIKQRLIRRTRFVRIEIARQNHGTVLPQRRDLATHQPRGFEAGRLAHMIKMRVEVGDRFRSRAVADLAA